MYSPDELLALSDFARQALVLAVRTQDLQAEAGEDYVTLEGNALKARCVLLAGEEEAQRCRVDLGVELVIDGARRHDLRTRTVGVGRSGEEATLQAVQIIVEGGLPPVLAALSASPPSPEGSGFTTTLDGQRRVWWEGFAGPVQTVSKHQAILGDHLKENPLIKLFGSPAAFGGGPFSWLQVALSKNESDKTTAQCLLNGSQWDGGVASVEGFVWPPAAGPMFFRQFFCIRARLV